MAKIQIGINLEFVRHHDLPSVAGVENAAAMGYAQQVTPVQQVVE